MALTWEDKDVKFDLPFFKMRLTAGEQIVNKLDNIEDIKGNNGEKGRMIVTNLRLLWHSILTPRISLSIGFNCIINMTTSTINSKIRGTTQAITLLTHSNNSRFEFIFSSLTPGNPGNFFSVIETHKEYMASKLYRELKLRGAIVHNKQLKILPLEQIYSTVHGMWNLSTDQGSPGTFFVTNVRIVWFADTNETFNISLPYLQIDSIKIRQSKFGTTLVITSTENSGFFVLGFRLEPEEKLQTLHKEITSLLTIYTESPIYGVECRWKNIKNNEDVTSSFQFDVEETNDLSGEISNILTSYLIDETDTKYRPPIYSQDLGLAIESLSEDLTLQKLWKVII